MIDFELDNLRCKKCMDEDDEGEKEIWVMR